MTLEQMQENDNLKLINKQLQLQIISHDVEALQWRELARELLEHLRKHSDEMQHASIISKAQHQFIKYERKTESNVDYIEHVRRSLPDNVLTNINDAV